VKSVRSLECALTDDTDDLALSPNTQSSQSCRQKAPAKTWGVGRMAR